MHRLFTYVLFHLLILYYRYVQNLVRTQSNNKNKYINKTIFEESMFTNKKSILPPRPQIPDSEHILEDLSGAALGDVVFKIINKGEISGENTSSLSTSDTYQRVKMYLNIKQQLKHLEATLKKKEERIGMDNEEIKKLADDIKKQAKAALIT